MQNIEILIPNFSHTCELLCGIEEFSFTLVEARVVAMMLNDLKTRDIARLLHRSYKTINQHQVSSLKKTACNTFFAMAIKIKKYLS